VCTLEDIIEDLEFLDEDMERLRYVVDLGKDLTAFPAELHTQEFLVQGCSSQVWLVPRVIEGDPAVLEFVADADAQIVRGLVALLLLAFSGKTAEQIMAVNVDELLERLRFTDQLTPGRQNGLFAMVSRIRDVAEQQLGRQKGLDGEQGAG